MFQNLSHSLGAKTFPSIHDGKIWLAGTVTGYGSNQTQPCSFVQSRSRKGTSLQNEASNIMKMTNDRAETTARLLAFSLVHSPAPSTVSPLAPSPATSSQVSSSGTAPTPPATPNPPASPCQPCATKKMARGSSFKVAQDEQMMKAWVRVSKDAVIGSDQKWEAFLKATHELCNKTKNSNFQLRSAEFVKKRTKNILKNRFMFHPCVARVNNNLPSVTSHANCVHLATLL